MRGLLQKTLEFLKKHYEKIILCAVLLGLAAAAVWMGEFINDVKSGMEGVAASPAGKRKALAPLDLTTDYMALALVTNPPPVVLSGDHNLLNPVTWRRMPDGNLRKILHTGPDALSITNIIPLYTEIGYNHSSGGGIYVLDIETHSVKKALDYAKKDETKKGRAYIIRGIKGAIEDPDALVLEIVDTGQTVTISKNNPFKEVDGHIAEMFYPPESRNLPKVKLDDNIALDNEEYKVVEITNNLVRVKSLSNGKETTVPWTRNP